MITSTATLTATPPECVPDGSGAYDLEATNNGVRLTGFIYVAHSLAVYAKVDRAPWQCVGTVASPGELNPVWVAEHADVILREAF